MPRASAAVAMVLAVYMPPQAPGPGQALRMISERSFSSMRSYWNSPYAWGAQRDTKKRDDAQTPDKEHRGCGVYVLFSISLYVYGCFVGTWLTWKAETMSSLSCPGEQPARMVPPYTMSDGRFRRAMAIRHPGMFLSQPRDHIRGIVQCERSGALWRLVRRALLASVQAARLGIHKYPRSSSIC